MTISPHEVLLNCYVTQKHAAGKQDAEPHFKGKRQQFIMKYFKLRAQLPSHRLRFFNLVLLGAVLAAVAVPVFEKARAQDTGSEAAPVNPETVAALEKRVKILEGQINDLRTMIGTISSLRQRPNLAVPAGVSPSAREAGPAASTHFAGPPAAGPGFASQGPRLAGEGTANMGTSGNDSTPRESGFSAGRMASRGPSGGERGMSGPQPANQGSESLNVADAQKLYNEAYSHMLRRDYASAAKAFDALVRHHPRSRMAGNAQYWLGETYYVRGKYRPAADAFLKAYRNYPNGVKAPGSLMKLALSLKKLGQTQAACKTFDELAIKYPNAPIHVKQRAGMERRRAACN